MKTQSKNRACPDRQDAILDAIEGRLSGEAADTFARHLEACSGCAEEHTSLIRTLSALGENSRSNFSDENLSDMRRNVRAALSESTARRGIPIRPAWGMAAALVLLALFWWGVPREDRNDKTLLAQVEHSGRAGLDEGRASSPALLEQVLDEDFPLDEDLDHMIDELSSAEIEALSRRLAALTVSGSEQDPS